MKSVQQMLNSKGNDLWSVDPDRSVLEALEVLAEHDIGALLVMQESKLVGIFSERDYARKVILKGKASRDTAVAEIMTADVVTVGPEDAIEACMELMTDKRIRHLPVLEDNQVIGVISIGDVVKDIIAEQGFVIEQLENFISGSG